ncbi:hypothetical protein J5X07_00655 [Actinomyces bowdenii]|uniref:hypothetical protein n=1 Tax=Actinomyces bowdenii TaxID=131109 RepID=UPI001ABCC323|nr:hypothetical protein [Actinomyces bowdenii]MBO3723554.1 hypothetical protein [Actinomyces bowdenii]
MAISAPAGHAAAAPGATTIKVQASTGDGARALAERELRFVDLKVAMAANPLDESYRAELADWESQAWS